MKKGFTLIELLAVIVILAIIALIATPIVLSIIEDSKESSMLRSSEMYLDAVEYAIAKGVLNNIRVENDTYNILTNGNICIKYDGSNCKTELEVEVKGEKPISGTITMENGAIKNHTLTYESNITIVDGSIGENEKVCRLTLDENNNGEPDEGDLVVCAGDNFYVVPNDPVAHKSATADTITLMVEYPITPTNNPEQKQNADFVSFSDDQYWGEYGNIVDSYEEKDGFVYDSNSNLYPYIEAYKTKLNVNILEASILSIGQWNTITTLRNQGKYSNIVFESFWLGNFYESIVHSLYWYDSENDMSYDYSYPYVVGCIRPVIIINKDSIQ